MSQSTPPLRELLELAVRAAHQASQDILAAFRSANLPIERKADGSVVTQADKDGERRIRAVFSLASPPVYPVLGEEMGDDTQGSRFRWTVDPIDGTLGYTRGLPTFGTLIGFDDASAARALVGVIHLPAFGETYAAGRGLGASCNGSPIGVAPRRELSECIVSASSLRDFQKAGLEEGYVRLAREVKSLRGTFDCWSHAMAARGALDAVVEFALNRWDIAPTEAIIEEGGGTCIIRPSRVTPGKFDAAFGNSQAVHEVARLIGF
jgi:fructose-1,6-bisphosphatase/inositol monophosphatase family enzyme